MMKINSVDQNKFLEMESKIFYTSDIIVDAMLQNRSFICILESLKKGTYLIVCDESRNSTELVCRKHTC